MKKTYTTIVLLVLCLVFLNVKSDAVQKYSVVVYGVEPEGVMAAVASAREGVLIHCF